MSKDEIMVTKKDLIVVVGIMVAMLGSLVYGFFLIKENQKPAPSPPPMTCWEQYQDQGENVAIQMCEVHDGE
jgi:hypothetical protein